MIKNILFDLDGTLTDPRPGVVRSIQYAMQKLDIQPPEEKDLLWCIGPPLIDSFKILLGNSGMNEAEKALQLYRERYSREGKFENSVYQGIPEALYEIRHQGFDLFVATSKPEVFALEILEHFNLSKYFTKIYGSRLNGELCKKGDLITHILKHRKLDKSRTLMVGDRKYDIAGARQCGIRNLGVTYGYGTKEELQEAYTDAIVNNPDEIPAAAMTMLMKEG